MCFEEKIKAFILQHHLLETGGKYIVALSGGADSVALLRVLESLGYNIEAAHCNFHLRGAESDRDEDFCKDLCEKEAIPLHIVHFDTVSYAQLHKVSIEMAARNLRYHWFYQLCSDINAAAICVAHHQDDQVETVLLNIIRGTGLRGLTGMAAKTSLQPIDAAPVGSASAPVGSVIRPLLCVSHQEILSYLQTLHQSFVIDSSNLKDDVQRNKLRLDIIPMIEKVNPAAKRNILRMTENLQDIQYVVSDSLDKAVAAVRLPQSATQTSPSAGYTPTVPECLPAFDRRRLAAYPAPLTLLWHILSPYAFNRSQTEEITESVTQDGTKQYGRSREWLSGTHVAILDKERLYIIDRREWETPLPTLRIPEPGLYSYCGSHLRIEHTPITDTFIISKDPLRVTLDGDSITFPLTIRPIHDGDRIKPFGMHGKAKLVSDYLKDRKRSVPDRHRQLVLTDGTGRILWLVGECIADDSRITKGKSRTAMTIELRQEG